MNEIVPLASLELDPENLRIHKDNESIPALKSSLELFGQMKNIVVHHNTVIAGNGLAQAALELGWNEIEIKRCPDEWTSEQAQAFAVADNRTAELSVWDFQNLPIVLEALLEDGFEFKDLGWDAEQLKDLNEKSLEIEESMGMESKPIQCPSCGELFKLGKS